MQEMRVANAACFKTAHQCNISSSGVHLIKSGCAGTDEDNISQSYQNDQS